LADRYSSWALLNAAKPASFLLPQDLRVVFLAFNDDFSPTKVTAREFRGAFGSEQQGPA
jgi:hypothetical protein